MKMVDWKGIRNFLLGGAIGYGTNELMRRNDERKIRLGIFKGSALIFATYMSFTQLGPGCLKLVETQQKINHEENIKKMDNDLIKDTSSTLKYRKLGFQEFNDSLKVTGLNIVAAVQKSEQNLGSYIQNKTDNLSKGITSIVSGQEQIVGTQKMISENQRSLANGQNSLLQTQKDIVQEQKTMTEYQSKNLEFQGKMSENLGKNNSVIESMLALRNQRYAVPEPISVETKISGNYSNTNQPGLVSKIKPQATFKHYVIDIDKSSRTLSIYSKFSDESQKLNNRYHVSLAKNNGPPEGEYKIGYIGERGGELYPGVMKLDDIIVITGSGDKNQHDNEIENGMLANKTGIRMFNKDYSQLESMIDGKPALVRVKE
jgi:hypothetical protein